MSKDKPLFSAGDVLNGIYEIRSLIGQGGMGQVFEAFDTTLSRNVAVKASLPSLNSVFLKEEAKALAAFSHPSVVTVYSIGKHRGVDFMVMERLYGSSLVTHLSRRSGKDRMVVEEVLDVLIAIADGLAQLHRAGIAHRDLKPANIMLCPGNRVVLMDFGLVLRESAREDFDDPCGTPQYMAPEIVARTTQPGNRKLIDIYALGTIAYEMLIGEVPFEEGTPEQVMQRQLFELPRRLSLQRNDIPPALEELLLSMLAKSPFERPQTAEAVSWTLRQIRSNAKAEEERPLSVLIVDDDPHATRLLDLYVRAAAPNALIRTAPEGESGLALARESVPDLLLLDLLMPGMNGLELAMYLRATHLFDRCRIVALSGRAGEHDIRLLRDLGISEFIPKSAQTREQLAAVVEQVVRARATSVLNAGPVSVSA